MKSVYNEWPIVIGLNRVCDCPRLRGYVVESIMRRWEEPPPEGDLVVCIEPLLVPRQWHAVKPLLEALVVSRRWVVVHAMSAEVARLLPDFCHLLYRPSTWAANLPLGCYRGRRVWIARGHPRDQWRAFLDLLSAGIAPVGVTINVTKKLWSESFTPVAGDATICAGTASLIAAWRRRVGRLIIPVLGG